MQKAWQIILAGCALRFLESAGPLATDRRLVAGNMQTAAAIILQEDTTTRPYFCSIHLCSGLISLRPQEIRCRGFTERDQGISLMRKYIDTMLAAGISAGE